MASQRGRQELAALVGLGLDLPVGLLGLAIGLYVVIVLLPIVLWVAGALHGLRRLPGWAE